MKRLLPFITLVLCNLLSLHAFDGYLDVTNFAEIGVTEIHISHISEDSWGDNLLEKSLLTDSETIRIELVGKPSSIFNILIIDENENTYTFENVDVEQQDVLVTPRDMDPVLSETEETEAVMTENGITGPGGDYAGSLTFGNRTSYTIAELYIKHIGEEDWGSNLLGDGSIPDGGDFTVNLDSYPDRFFDLRAVDEGSDTYTLNEVDAEGNDLRIRLDELD